MKPITSAVAICASFLFFSSLHGQTSSTEIEVTILDKKTHQPVACRVHLKDSAGKPVFSEGWPKWRDHFVCSGTFKIPLSAGQFTYEIERGPEYKRSNGSLDRAETKKVIELERIANLAAEG